MPSSSWSEPDPVVPRVPIIVDCSHFDSDAALIRLKLFHEVQLDQAVAFHNSRQLGFTILMNYLGRLIAHNPREKYLALHFAPPEYLPWEASKSNILLRAARYLVYPFAWTRIMERVNVS